MKKLFALLAAAGASALLFSACTEGGGEGQEDPSFGKMTINGTTFPLRCAFYGGYQELPYETVTSIGMFPENFIEMPEEEPEIAFFAEVSESYLGREIDLTKPLEKTGTLFPIVALGVFNDRTGVDIEMELTHLGVDIWLGNGQSSVSVTKGTLYVSRSGNHAIVKLSLKLSDGTEIDANWDGAAKEVIEDEEME